LGTAMSAIKSLKIIALFMSNCVVHVKNEIGFFRLLQIVSVDGIEFR
jgi:hypothetical protein